MRLMLHKLFDSEDQAYCCGVIVVCDANVSSTVSLEEVLIAGGFFGHALFGVGLLTEIRGSDSPIIFDIIINFRRSGGNEKDSRRIY